MTRQLYRIERLCGLHEPQRERVSTIDTLTGFWPRALR